MTREYVNVKKCTSEVDNIFRELQPQDANDFCFPTILGFNAFTTGNPFWGQNYLDLV